MDYRALPSVDIVHDMTVLPWPFKNSTFERVYSSHCLEHAEPFMVPRILAEMGRVLKPDGTVELHVPDVEALCWFHDWLGAANYIFGTNSTSYGKHLSGFWKIGLESLMQKVGFSNVKVIRGFFLRSAGFPCPELVCTATKTVLPFRSLTFTPKPEA